MRSGNAKAVSNNAGGQTDAVQNGYVFVSCISEMFETRTMTSLTASDLKDVYFITLLPKHVKTKFRVCFS